jgi:hypothetical protein
METDPLLQSVSLAWPSLTAPEKAAVIALIEELLASQHHRFPDAME